MRLHRLELMAFGPFAAEQVINFDELTVSGLFLLDGPTGAGKTTVLDAITFALYGPGERNGDGRLRSHFAPRDCAPRVQLEFSVRGVRHRVTRSPEFERPKRRGDGTTRQAAQAHLERFESDRWVSRSSNKAEIADMLADELGLTRDQFTQVVVLPQGEFARFLRASDDDRRALLTKLFGTQLYDRITDELERQGQAAARDLEAASRRLRSCLSAAGEAAGLSSAAREELCDLEDPDRMRRLTELHDALAEARADTDRVAALTNVRCAAAREQVAVARRAVERVEQFAAALARAERHEQQRPAHEAARGRLDSAQRAERVRGLLDALDDAVTAVADATRALQAADPSTEPQTFASADVESVDAEAARLLRKAAELQHLVDQEGQLTVLLDEVTRLAAAADHANTAMRRHSERHDALPEEIKAADHELAHIHEILAVGERARLAMPALQAACAASHRVAELTEQRSVLLALRDKAVVAHQRTVDAHQRAVDTRLLGMAAELAQRLAEGAPCPVCGGTEHPQPARPEPGAVTASDVQALVARRGAAQARREAAEAQLAALDVEVAAARARQGDVPIAELERTLRELDDHRRAADTALLAEPQLRRRRDDLSHEARDLAPVLAAAQTAAATASATAAAAQQRCLAMDAALSAARGECATVLERQRQLRERAGQLERIAAAARTRIAALDQLERADARAQRAALSAGFETLGAVRAVLLDPGTLGELAAQVDAWEVTDRVLGAALRAPEFTELAASLTSSATRIDPELARLRTDAARADDELAIAIAGEEVAAAALATAAHAQRRFDQARADVDSARADYDREATDSEAVRYLSKLTRGMAGQRRVALTTFVLRRWFDHVVNAANVRLLTISSGRYELVRVDDAGARVERAGLTLQVIDRHTGEARPARSLSGGETFYTSLALALGLADVVRAQAGGIDLDTLFIDEGFGSLDAQTLDEVMAVIEDLRDRGRVVGIVSHVTELKELIHERVEVRRLPDGSSTLRVVA